MKIKSKILNLACSVAVGSLFANAISAQERVLNVTNWGEYIAEDTISNFENEYGIKVVYDAYDSAEAIDAKLLAGSSGYDVVSHSGGMTARLIQAGIISPLDTSKLDQLKNSVDTPPCKMRSSTSLPTSLSASFVTTAVRNPKHFLSPLATLYSPPPSHTSKDRALRIRPGPGSSRSMTSPSDRASNFVSPGALIFSMCSFLNLAHCLHSLGSQLRNRFVIALIY